jgi:predicted dehydrogenase
VRVTWRIGLVGVGQFAQQAYLPALRAMDDVEVSLLCGRSLDRIESVKRDWSLDARVEVGVEGLVRACKDDAVDAVIVAVPDRYHEEMVRAALHAELHVLCEKPITINAESARDLRDLASSAGVVSMMAFTYRYTLALQKAHQLIEEGAIGDVASVFFEVHWGGENGPFSWREDGGVSPGGIWFDGGSHMVDTVGVLVGPMRGTHVNTATITRSDGLRATNPDVAMVTGAVERGSAWLTLTHRESGDGTDNKIPVGGVLSRLDRMTGDQVRVIGSRGGVSLSLGRGDVEWLDVWSESGDRRRVLAAEEDGDESGAPKAVTRMVRAWIDGLERGALSEWDAGFDVGCAVQEVLSGIELP